MLEQTNQNKEEFHIGRLIKQKLKEDDRNISWLSKKLGCDCSNLHKTLEQKDIYTDLLFKISDVMDVDFFVYYSQRFKKKKESKLYQ